MKLTVFLSLLSLTPVVLSLPSLKTDTKDKTLNEPTLNALELEARGQCWFGASLGCSKSGYCWQVCNESDGTWCWLARDGGNGEWEYCGVNVDGYDHCLNVIRKNLVSCALGNCKDCGCRCW
jgi:hypothetical protein